jgi:hypothetical protein
MDALANLAFMTKINCGIRVLLICVEIRDTSIMTLNNLYSAKNIH